MLHILHFQNIDDTATTAAEKKEAPAKPAKLGDVGYEFRKKFDAGWFAGKVTAILPNAPNEYDRWCVYTDGDAEDGPPFISFSLSLSPPLSRSTKRRRR